MKHRENETRDDSWSYVNRRDQRGLNVCCTAVWKANGKTNTLLHFSGSLFPKTQKKCEILPLEVKRSGDRLLRHSDLRGDGGSVSKGNAKQKDLQQEGLQTQTEGISQLREWNMESKDFESRRQIRDLKKCAEKHIVCSGCQ